MRVPAFAVWPGVIESGSVTDEILTTLDYFPTIQQIVGYSMPDDRPIDGENVLPILTGNQSNRSKSIAFRYGGGVSSLVKGQYKFLLPSRELYDLSKDRAEENNVTESMPERASEMEEELVAFFQDVKRSHSGGDYDASSFKPVADWKPLKTTRKR